MVVFLTDLYVSFPEKTLLYPYFGRPRGPSRLPSDKSYLCRLPRRHLESRDGEENVIAPSTSRSCKPPPQTLRSSRH